MKAFKQTLHVVISHLENQYFNCSFWFFTKLLLGGRYLPTNCWTLWSIKYVPRSEEMWFSGPDCYIIFCFFFVCLFVLFLVLWALSLTIGWAVRNWEQDQTFCISSCIIVVSLTTWTTLNVEIFLSIYTNNMYPPYLHES